MHACSVFELTLNKKAKQYNKTTS